MTRAAALVSDSTSVDLAMAKRLDVTVVPLQVIIGAKSYDEGAGASPDDVASALQHRQPVSTSRPAPDVFRRAYHQHAQDGADANVSVHL